MQIHSKPCTHYKQIDSCLPIEEADSKISIVVDPMRKHIPKKLLTHRGSKLHDWYLLTIEEADSMKIVDVYLLRKQT